MLVAEHILVTQSKILSHHKYLQSRCFFFGPMSSSVVALHTALARPCPASECFAANILSFKVCPPKGAAILGLYLGLLPRN